VRGEPRGRCGRPRGSPRPLRGALLDLGLDLGHGLGPLPLRLPSDASSDAASSASSKYVSRTSSSWVSHSLKRDLADASISIGYQRRSGVCTVMVNRFPKRGDSVSTAPISSQRNSASWSSRLSRTPLWSATIFARRSEASKTGPPSGASSDSSDSSGSSGGFLAGRVLAGGLVVGGVLRGFLLRGFLLEVCLLGRLPLLGGRLLLRGRLLGDGLRRLGVLRLGGARARDAGHERRIDRGALQGLDVGSYALLHSGQYGRRSCARNSRAPLRPAI
jgi:hypothetical protein